MPSWPKLSITDGTTTVSVQYYTRTYDDQAQTFREFYNWEVTQQDVDGNITDSWTSSPQPNDLISTPTGTPLSEVLRTKLMFLDSAMEAYSRGKEEDELEYPQAMLASLTDEDFEPYTLFEHTFGND